MIKVCIECKQQKEIYAKKHCNKCYHKINARKPKHKKKQKQYRKNQRKKIKEYIKNYNKMD